mgnify:CR=1 FL=1
MKVVVVLSNLIIGEHIRCLLSKNGFETLDNVVTGKDLNQILLHGDSDYFIVNDRNLEQVAALIKKSSQKTYSGKIVNLKNSSIFNSENRSDDKYEATVIENPFMSYEVISVLL